MAPPQKKYVCGYCARAFTRSEHKQRHERSHTNEKPFHCLYCPSAFVRRDLLQRHCRTVHNIRLVLRSTIKESPEAAAKHNSDVISVDEKVVKSNLDPVISGLKTMIPNNSPRSDATEGPVSGEVASAQMLLQLAPACRAPEDSDRYYNSLDRSEHSSNARNLYSASKKLELLYDSSDLHYPVDDMFLAGYWVLARDTSSGFEAREFVDYLHSRTPGASEFCDYKAGIAYTILAAGALTIHLEDFSREEVATLFMNKAWNILVDRLMIQNNNVDAHSEILRNLYLLTYTYIRFFNNCLMVAYLEDSALAILQNLSSYSEAVASRVVLLNIQLFWRIYTLVSKHKTSDMPPKFYSWYLSQPIDATSNNSLLSLMKSFSLATYPLSDPFICDVVICTLSNELNNYVINKSLWVYDLRAALHNAIMMVNKSTEKSMLLASVAPHVFGSFKEKLIFNAPHEFKSLLDDYVFNVSKPHHWELLSLTLRDYNTNFNFRLFVKENLNSPFQKFGNDLLAFFSGTSDELSIQEGYKNVGIVSYPLIFNYSFLRLNHMTSPIMENLDILELTNLSYLILEWQVTVVKVLINLVSNRNGNMTKTLQENVILRGLLYMMGDGDSRITQFSPEYFLLVFNKLTKICETWSNIVDRAESLNTLRTNLNRFLSDLFVLALNNDRLLIEDVYITNESILLRSKRSKSIGSIDMGFSPYKSDASLRTSSSTQSSHLSFPSTTSNHNYVLMKKSSLLPQTNAHKTPYLPDALSPTQSLPPLQMLSVFTPATGLSTSPNNITPLAHLILPPLRTTIKEMVGSTFPVSK